MITREEELKRVDEVLQQCSIFDISVMTANHEFFQVGTSCLTVLDVFTGERKFVCLDFDLALYDDPDFKVKILSFNKYEMKTAKFKGGHWMEITKESGDKYTIFFYTKETIYVDPVYYDNYN